MYDSPTPQDAKFPEPWESKVKGLDRYLVDLILCPHSCALYMRKYASSKIIPTCICKPLFAGWLFFVVFDQTR